MKGDLFYVAPGDKLLDKELLQSCMAGNGEALSAICYGCDYYFYAGLYLTTRSGELTREIVKEGFKRIFKDDRCWRAPGGFLARLAEVLTEVAWENRRKWKNSIVINERSDIYEELTSWENRERFPARVALLGTLDVLEIQREYMVSAALHKSVSGL
jgi:hypothetical protein